MEENDEPYSFDLNLDFLDSTTTTSTKHVQITTEYQENPQIHTSYDIESLANRIATVNDMAIQMKATQDDNTRLQKQMQELSESAMSIRSMYEQEKSERLKIANSYRDLQETYEKTESQLANKTFHFEQIQSRLEQEAEDKKPIPYNDLALKYQRLALQLEEDKLLPTKEKVTHQLVKDYLESKKLHPLPSLKKKSHPKVKNRDFSMQCNLKVESESQETQCSFEDAEEEPKDTCTQGTQYAWYTTTRGTNTPAWSNPKTEMKTQGTQYISSTTTRATSTSTFIQTQSVGTNFPEPVPPVSIEDIFNEMICDVSPLSPMSASPQTELKEEKVEMKSIGSCTDLKNVRKPIDYIGANIKHSDSRPPSRNSNLYDRVKNEIPMMGMPTMNPFAGLGIPVTPMHNTVAELWNMLGHTIFALLQQNGGNASATINPMHMNLLNDRMRNLSGRNRTPSEQQRNCESQTRDDYFEQEYHREYSTATRSAATSPILGSELQINQPQSRLAFDHADRSPNQPVEIQKILLNTNFSDPIISSTKKTSQVDEILKLFPEYSDSFKKRKAIKRLLKEVNKNKRPKKKRNSCSSSSSVSTTTQSTAELQPSSSSCVPVSASCQSAMKTPQAMRPPQANLKTEIFGDSDSDSSLDSSIMDYIKAHTPRADPEQKWTPHQTKPPLNELALSLDIKQTRIKSPIEEEFLGFDEESNLPPLSDEVFCKPLLPPKRQKSVILSDSSIPQSINVDRKCEVLVKPEPNHKFGPINPPNPKRKRKTKQTDLNQTNKIFKLENCILPESERLTESKKPKKSSSLNKNKPKQINILPLQPTISTPINKPLRSLSLNKIKKPKEESKQLEIVPQNQTNQGSMHSTGYNKPDWMNRINEPKDEDLSIHVSQNHHGPMVMKVEKPPDSVFQDIKTCFSNQKQDSILPDIKTCFSNPTNQQEKDTKPFIGPIMPNNQTLTNVNAVSPEQSIPFVAPKEDGTYRFLIQNHLSTINMNMNASISPIKSPENSLKIVNYYEPAVSENVQERNSKSSITILNEQWISQSNDLRPTKQESPLNIVTTDACSLDQKTLDLENMPIYFIDDQNLLQNQAQQNDPKLPFDPHQGTPYNCQNVKILPGFEEIQQRPKTVPAQFIASSKSQKQELQMSRRDEFQLNCVVQDSSNSFLQNCVAMNTTESTSTTKDLKPLVAKAQNNTSYLVLNHQQNLNCSKESSICSRIEEKMEEELDVLSTQTCSNEEKNLNTNEMPDLHASNDLIGKFSNLSRSEDKSEPMIEEKDTNTSMFLLPNRNLFGTKILPSATSNDNLSSDDKLKVVEIQSPETVCPLTNDSFTPKHLKISNSEPKINSSVMEYHSQESSPRDKNTCKSSTSLTIMDQDDTNSSYSSDTEGDLSIDLPASPQPNDKSALDLSTILKTPEKDTNPEVQFKTPNSYLHNNSLITKVITNSTEKLVEEYLLNESPGEEGPKFQVFLDRILDDVAPPSSPVSALALSEKTHNSETDSSCDETQLETTMPRKYKRKAAATAAIAVKRSTRIKAKQFEAASMVNSLCAMTVPNIELGKYTKKKTEKQHIKQEQIAEPIIEEKKIVIQTGFFKETMDGDDEAPPTCEPIKRDSVGTLDKNINNEKSLLNHSASKRKPEDNIISHSVKSMLTTRNDGNNLSSLPLEVESYQSLLQNAQQSISRYLKPEEPYRPPNVELYSLSKNVEESSSFCYESPASPPSSDQEPTERHIVRESFDLSPVTKANVSSSQRTVLSHLIANYNQEHHAMLTTAQKFDTNLLDKLQFFIKEFLSGLCLVMDAVRFVDSVLQLTSDEKLISKAIVCVVKAAPRPETEVTGPIPDTYLSHTHRKLLTMLDPLCRHFQNLHSYLQSTIEKSLFTFTKEIISVEALMNLTQFYLAIIDNPNAGTNPARLFICKCLYFFNVKAIPMIYQTLCVYPTVLPQRVDPAYDRSDILISTIQSILMSTYYDPAKCDIMTRQILAKLRMFYNYESFKPPRDEVIENIISKIRAGRFKNVPYALSLICKRMEQNQTEKFILNERLMPLANEFYHTLSEGSDNDEKIACVLECISYVIKPFSLDTDISQYVNLFGRFLNAATDRKIIQEAAVGAILRTSRFGYVQCFNAVYNFKPTYELSETLELMLRSFIYKKGKAFLKALERQAQELVAT